MPNRSVRGAADACTAHLSIYRSIAVADRPHGFLHDVSVGDQISSLLGPNKGNIQRIFALSQQIPADICSMSKLMNLSQKALRLDSAYMLKLIHLPSMHTFY